MKSSREGDHAEDGANCRVERAFGFHDVRCGRDHELKLIPSNTHTGSFDARIKPVLRIAPGDTVKVETLVPFGMDRLLAAGASEAEIPDSVKAMDKYMKEKGLYG